MPITQFFKFSPILKEKIWGGEKLMQLLDKSSVKKNIGESWEISDVPGDTSVVANGALQGTTIKELITTYKGGFLGTKVYEGFGDNFPLLIKFIDAKEALSIQLHPNDALAKARHNSFGKTEMWYVLQADEKANLIVGFQEKISPQAYVEHVANNTLLAVLNVDEVAEGDVYFIPTGRIHAIGAGVLLAEIQQTSDVTYRIYDWDRQDTAGNKRVLHTVEAIDSIDYTMQDSYRTAYKKELNKTMPVVSCPYFTTNIVALASGVTQCVDHTAKDSFVIYMCVKGTVLFTAGNEASSLKMGETLLVPACLESFQITASQESTLLEVYIK